jgi:(Z)-2-((N-methylformamido)methylene)-5-hydroxybutyrolactone dehydrogenase
MTTPVRYQMLIGGKRADASGGATLPAIDPFRGAEFARIPDAAPEDVRSAVAAARTAFAGGWSATPGIRRAELMHRLAALIDEHADTLGALESTDNGKLVRETISQAHFAARNYRFFAGYADKLYGRHECTSVPPSRPSLISASTPRPFRRSYSAICTMTILAMLMRSLTRHSSSRTRK